MPKPRPYVQSKRENPNLWLTSLPLSFLLAYLVSMVTSVTIETGLVDSGYVKTEQHGFPLPYMQPSFISSSQSLYFLLPLIFDLFVYFIITRILLIPLEPFLKNRRLIKIIGTVLWTVGSILFVSLVVDILIGQAFLISPFKVTEVLGRRIQLGY